MMLWLSRWWLDSWYYQVVTIRNAKSLYDDNSMNNDDDPTIYIMVGDLYVCGGPWVYTRLGKTSLNR